MSFYSRLKRKRDREWRNLLDEKCPKCGLSLHQSSDGLQCGIVCGFFISNFKLREMLLKLKAKDKIVGKVKTLPNGKAQFKATKVFKENQRKSFKEVLGF